MRFAIRTLRVRGAVRHTAQQGAALGREEEQPLFLSKDMQWVEYHVVRGADEDARELVRTEAIYEMLHQSYWPYVGQGLMVQWTGTVSPVGVGGENAETLACASGTGTVSQGEYVAMDSVQVSVSAQSV